MAQGKAPTTSRPAKPMRQSTKRVATRSTVGNGAPIAPKRALSN